MSDDPLRDYAAYEAAQDRKSRHYPRCELCEGYITDELQYRINGKVLCLECVKDMYGEEPSYE